MPKFSLFGTGNQNINVMEWNKENENENKKEVRNDLIDIDSEDGSPRNEENMEKNTSSNPTTKFEKNHTRTNNALGDGHEPGTIPGTGV